jgi:hypothetical protein
MKNAHSLDNLMKDYFRNVNQERCDFSRKIIGALDRERVRKMRFSALASCVFISIMAALVFALPFFWYFSSQFIGAVLDLWGIPFEMSEHVIVFFSLICAPALIIIFIKTIRMTKAASPN